MLGGFYQLFDDVPHDAIIYLPPNSAECASCGNLRNPTRGLGHLSLCTFSSIQLKCHAIEVVIGLDAFTDGYPTSSLMCVVHRLLSMVGWGGVRGGCVEGKVWKKILKN